jgi:uncharacterized protein DUF4160
LYLTAARLRVGKNVSGLVRVAARDGSVSAAIEQNSPSDGFSHSGFAKTSAKFWLQPLALVRNFGFSPRELAKIRALIEENQNQLLEAWHGHFGTKR